LKKAAFGRPMDEKEARLSSRNIVHRDIKPKNIMISARSIAISLEIGFEDEMHRIFLHPDLIGRILIGMTNARGGHDNVSVSLLTHIG
jgi:serine/threonine protein kinase